MKESRVIWFNGEFMPWEQAQMHPISQALHYGLAPFEGIRFYHTDRGPAIFRLRKHLKRLLYSAKVVRMEIQYSLEELVEIIKELIRRNSMEGGYIRPCFFYGGETIGLEVRDSVIEGVIAVLPWPNPSREFLRVKTSPYRRLDPRSIDINAKISGHYVNSFSTLHEAKESGFEDAILLDQDGYVAEASVENIFAVKGGVVYTPKLGSILPGITRDTLIIVARDIEFQVEEKDLRIQFFREADEVFVCGTAMKILAVGEIDGVAIGNRRPGKVTRRLAQLYKDIVEGRDGRYIRWLTFVN
ncbi:branched-chain amino acid transaminase [Patescibacteria group bacterium AH-259-L07]|nr:branched-chain amino acid transaminase [Patescibacteria group bacterium AH-259-L07]